MTGPGCSKTKSGAYRKHTPIVSEAQRRLFYAAASGKETKAVGLTTKKAKEHLAEAKGKHLVERVQKKLNKTYKKRG